MKKHVFTLFALCTVLCLCSCGKGYTPVEADTYGEIHLLEPDMSLKTTMMQALQDRKSTRTYAPEMLSLEDLSNLLWAANGINRKDGNRTAPSAQRAMDIDIYVCTVDGAYLYDAQKLLLKRVTEEDIRNLLADGRDVNAPLFLLMVSDVSRFPFVNEDYPRAVEWGGLDAAYISGNINLFCAAAGLATVPRVTMDKEKVRRALHLRGTQLPMINNPIGYFNK